MAISNAQRAKINKMNRASQDVSLGTIVQNLQTGSATLNGYIRSTGSYTAVEADSNASKVVIATGLTGVVGYMVQVYTSGSQKSTIKVINSGSNLTVTAGSAATSTVPAITTGDVTNWMVW